jgi:hypothetical protein
MRPSKAISDWLFATLGGVFVENATLYVPRGAVSEGVLNVVGATVQDGALVAYSITEGRVYPIATREDVKTPYMTYDNITVSYEATKDGAEPDGLSFRVLCVERDYDAVVALADAVAGKLNNAWVDILSSALTLTSRRSSFDAATGEYLEELTFELTI